MFNIKTIIITPEILGLISKIDEFKGAWRSMKSLPPERLSALRHVATTESIGSSTRIEGSKLTNVQVEALLAKLEIEEFATRDEQEVAGYAEVMALIFNSWPHIPFNENHITQLHRDLLAHSDKDVHHRGVYKTNSNQVAAFDAAGNQIAVIFETATPFNTPRLMQELLEWVRYTRDQELLHPLLVVAILVVVFLEIHPFQDGNGRLSRVLTTLLLLQAGYAYVPYSSLESIVEQNKQGYYIALRQTQGTIRTDEPDWQPWITFFLSTLCSQVKRLEEKIAHVKLVMSVLPELSLQILTLARAQGRVTLSAATAQTKAKSSTVRLHLSKLVKEGHLLQQGVGRATWYSPTSYE